MRIRICAAGTVPSSTSTPATTTTRRCPSTTTSSPTAAVTTFSAPRIGKCFHSGCVWFSLCMFDDVCVCVCVCQGRID
jgi:hypothetical protein